MSASYPPTGVRDAPRSARVRACFDRPRCAQCVLPTVLVRTTLKPGETAKSAMSTPQDRGQIAATASKARDARVLDGYAMMGRQVDVIETSRGCTFDCSFCSIIEMRGRNFHTYSFDRVIADIADAKAHGARTIFIIDDNITLNIERFEALCHAIIDAGHNDIDYTIQAMTSAIANHGDKLAPLMRKAGFRYVFLGIENILEDNLDFLVASAKNRLRKKGRRIGKRVVACD